MIRSIRDLPDGTALEADICIIGGGAAAIAMALALRASTLSVLVLESGGLTLEASTQSIAAGSQSGLRYFELDQSRFRLLGGSTIRWGARTTPLKPIDFAHRPWVPRSGWPITLDALHPYTDRIFDLVGLKQPFSFDAEVWDLFDQRPPSLDPERFEYAAFQFGKRLLFGEIYRKDLARAANIQVCLDANVTALRASPRGDHIARIDIATLTGGRYTARAQRYVLATGGIENARLLLASNAENPAGLCNEHDLVGRTFMEHPTVMAGRISSDRTAELHTLFSPGLHSGRLVEFGFALSPALQERHRCLSAVTRAVPELAADSTRALRELVGRFRRRRIQQEISTTHDPNFVTDRLALLARDPVGVVANVLRHAMGRPNNFRVESTHLQVRTEQAPNPESRVTLSTERADAFGNRAAHLHWELNDTDRRTVQVAAQAFDVEIRRLGLGRVELAPWLTEPGADWPDDLTGGHHHMGTTRMAHTAAEGVVDSNGKTFAIDNLFITGSSVFPTAGYSNPTMTVLALALRLADHLTELGRSPAGSARTDSGPGREG